MTDEQDQEPIFKAAGATDQGCKRDHNEDAILVCEETGLFCVADGMGGLHAGEVASGMIVDSLKAASDASDGKAVDVDLAEKALRDANGGIHQMAVEKRWVDSRGMAAVGSTATALVVHEDGQQATYLHAGDSRLYQLSNGSLSQVTKDHSMEEAVKEQLGDKITSTKINLKMFENQVTNAVGLKSELEVDRKAFDLSPGDVLLLCSDGLIRHIMDDEIETILASTRTRALDDVVTELIETTKERGARDNVSVVVVRMAGSSGNDTSVAADNGFTPVGIMTAIAVIVILIFALQGILA